MEDQYSYCVQIAKQERESEIIVKCVSFEILISSNAS